MKKRFVQSVILVLCLSIGLSCLGGCAPEAPTALPVTNLTNLKEGSWSYTGHVSDSIKYIEELQLKDAEMWASMVQHFRDQADSDGNGWRGEYWGKLMRGGATTYAYTQDAELYAVLETTTKDLLTTQDDQGRIASYTIDAEFQGWDMWNRKYVLVGLQSFYEICKDDALKQEILTAMEKHAGYILAKIGPEEEGKMPILLTSDQWGSMNSCSIIEPIMWMYNETKTQKYLDFAKYIIDCGGCSHDDIFEMAYEGTLKPYEYPVTKAYEMTSCFEGLLEYYRVTGEEKYLTAVKNYAYGLLESDITVIGCAGCAHELLNNASLQQTNPNYTGLMQETCVTSTWMRFCAQVLKETSDPVFADAFEVSMYNVALGAINRTGKGLPFDGYSPLMTTYRGRANGGACGNYGCCAAYGASGLGAIAFMSTMKSDEGVCVNLYLPGTVKTTTPSGKALQLDYVTNYPAEEEVKITVTPESAEEFAVQLRIPAWSTNTKVTVNGTAIEGVKAGCYVSLDREWKAGDTIVLTLDMRTRLLKGQESEEIPESQYFVALQRGPITLAMDSRLGDDLLAPQDIKADADGYVDVKASATADFSTLVEFEVPLTDGSTIHMVDYASAGSAWKSAMISVWIATEEYWKIDTKAPVLIINNKQDKHLKVVIGSLQKATYPSATLAPYQFTLEEAGDGYYRLLGIKDGLYLSENAETAGTNGGEIVLAEKADSDLQLWKLEQVARNIYRIVNKQTGLLISENGDNKVHMWGNTGAETQTWFIKNG